MFVTVRVTEGKLGLDSPNMPKEIIQKVEQIHNTSKNGTTNFITLKKKNNQ